ncbi:ABC-2 type transport system permease protein [Amycolatopsis sulphurea]|uniref:ABC-2 type transport system permease protein n=1 Tax=Amycolatopsis sulphurea TaxID=76022 RepID=A0A2A9FD92_9PSEU|nr:ABC transporter permease [Amycolatopsis sulphurea]PFG48399.1 ABC-2 type transport system permease protein [Amycolatopsis sulphurea]
MNLLAVERIKLFTTRAPLWGGLLTILVTSGFGIMYVASNAGHTDYLSVTSSTRGYEFGAAVAMVVAALSITTEYRFGTIRTAFQAVPNRTSVLLAKAGVVGLLGLVLGEISGFAAWGVSYLLEPTGKMALTTSADWINVTGGGVFFGLAAVIALSVGALIRHSAGALSLVLLWALMGERLISLVSDGIYRWLPFHVMENFLTPRPDSGVSLSQGGSLAYFAGFAVLMLMISIVVVNKRDA